MHQGERPTTSPTARWRRWLRPVRHVASAAHAGPRDAHERPHPPWRGHAHRHGTLGVGRSAGQSRDLRHRALAGGVHLQGRGAAGDGTDARRRFVVGVLRLRHRTSMRPGRAAGGLVGGDARSFDLASRSSERPIARRRSGSTCDGKRTRDLRSSRRHQPSRARAPRKPRGWAARRSDNFPAGLQTAGRNAPRSETTSPPAAPGRRRRRPATGRLPPGVLSRRLIRVLNLHEPSHDADGSD